MLKSDIIDLRTVFSGAFDINPLDATTKIHSEMHKLVEDELLHEERTFVYIVERRGSNLFRPFIDHIAKFHEIGTIRLYSDKSFAHIKEEVINTGKGCIILTDAIRTGDEISKIINILNKRNIMVPKVCGYLSNKETIEKLKIKYEMTKFEFIHEVEDYEHYKDYYGKLVRIHHSRLEPLDSEHPYYLYQTGSENEREKIETIISYVCGKANYYREKELLSDDIIGYTAEFDGAYALKVLSFKKNGFFDIERLQLRFRFDRSKSSLRIMAFCCVCDFNLEKITAIDEYVKRTLPNFEMYCEFLDDVPSKSEVICPLCLDVNLSLSILEKFDHKIKRVSIREGLEVKNILKYNPFFNF